MPQHRAGRTRLGSFPLRLRALAVGLAAALCVGVAVAEPVVAHAATVTPKADVFDVDFRNGSPDDQATGRSYQTYGSPAVAYDSGVNHVAASFNGTDNSYFYDMTNAWDPSRSPNITAGATIECWFRYDGAAAPKSEQEACSGIETGGYGIQLNTYSGKPLIRSIAYIGGAYRTLSTPLTVGVWNHIITTYDGTTFKLFVDGQLVSQAAYTGNVGAPGGRYFVLGGDTGATAPQKLSPTTIATSRIWSTALTDEQVAAVYQADTAPAETVPDADILDIDVAGGTFTDKVHGATPDIFGNPTISSDAGLGSKVANFDGSGQAVIYPITDAWDASKTPNVANSFSLECNFRFDGVVPTASEQDVCSGKQSGGFAIFASGSRIGTMARIAGSYRNVYSPVLATGVWHTAVATYDGAMYSLYVDGQLAGQTSISGAVDAPSVGATNYALGSDGNSSGLPEFNAPAAISQARIWSTALTPGQVAALNLAATGARQVSIKLKSSTPSAGTNLTAPVSFTANFTNQGSATGWSYTLDGTPITMGQEIGAGLAAGSHTIAITGTNCFGRPLSFTVPFTSGDIPLGGGTDTSQAKGSVTLSAIAASASKGEVTTTFTEATPTAATGGFTGAIASIPSSLEFGYENGSTFTTDQLSAGKIDSPSSHDLMPFQRFDVPVGSAQADRMVRWSGIVDPQRTASLYVWNGATSKWVKLDGAVGQADSDVTLSGMASQNAVDAGVVHVMVVAEDLFLDDLSARDSSAGTSAAKDHFENPADYDFSFVHWTDPQYLTEGATGGAGSWPASPAYASSSNVETADEQAVWAKAFQQALQWTADNASSKKIVYAANTGDIINNDYNDPDATNPDGSLTYPGLNGQVDAENAFASTEFKRLEKSGVVNQSIAGNHDNQLGKETGPDSRFSKAFSAANYYAQAQQWPAGASYHAWDETTDANGSVTAPGSDNQNNYVLFSAGGLDFVAVGLSYGVTKAEADWASSIFARYHDRNGILITHAYLAAATASHPDGRDVGTSGDGSRLYQQVAAANPNVFLVLAGHIHGVGTNVKSYKSDTVQITHHTVEMLADYQFYQMPASEIFTAQTCPGCVIGTDGSIDTNGDGTVDHQPGDLLDFGASYQRLLQFNVKDSTMSVDTYSPFMDSFGATAYDTDHRYNGAEDNFTVPVDLTSRKTSFSTTAMSVLSPTDNVIGTATVKSGYPASVTWKGLEAGKSYAWTATTTNADGSVVGSLNQFGGVFTATPQGTDTTAPVIEFPTGNVEQNASFDALQGVKATDNTDGDVSANLQVLGSVDTTKPGTYTLVYAVADANGNQAQVVRTVTVTATPKPDKATSKVVAKNVTAVVGTASTLTATVTPATATGTVSFYSGEDELCHATLSNGTATCNIAQLPAVGTYPVTVDYSGDDAVLPSHTAIAVKVVEATEPKSDTSTDGQALIMTQGTAGKLQIQVTGGTQVPTGTVAVTEGTKLLARPTLINGKAEVTFSAAGLSVGKHTLKLAYSGDGLHNASTSTVQVTVLKAVQASTKAKLSVKKRGHRLTITTVIAPSNASGKVKITIGSKHYTVKVKHGRAVKTIALPSGRTATVKVTFTPSDKQKYRGAKATKKVRLR